MEVSLTPELEAFVAEKVASGFCSSASEVIREALELLEEQDHAPNAALGQATTSRRAERIQPETVRERLRRRSQERRRLSA